ncbi:alpha/beta-hydrolase [Karstenula rhodostoma CBS 690.94]|uniref:Alpha/beta-hydrolase n=1 Tax=Karstenula rhodostoma CBS 690.94 TaxID=1392251 RepID=A0A9P4PRH4_9PLEO|nr:alpha/beta-hydrolase [Karstenula rhodostoma CBS 690.94]
MPTNTPFKIAIPDEKLRRLKKKLLFTDLPDEVTSTKDPWARGVPLSDIKRLTAYWAETFDWRKAETKLNELPQFVTTINVDDFGQYDVHYVHKKSESVQGIPLLFLHGWPGGFFEVSKLLPYLHGGESEAAFHVVAPSLVDFGFSSESKKDGFAIDQHAEVCHKLMISLGYNEYVVHGGDLGGLTARFIALKYGRAHCKAVHVTNVIPAEPTEAKHPEIYAEVQSTSLSALEIDGLARTAKHFSKASGYYQLASTRPQTLGYALADSPVALLAWIYEKLHDWVDSEYRWTDDDICTWVSIYWFSTAGPAASSRAFYEFENRQPEPAFPASQVYINVPLGVVRFANDIVLLPRLWNRTLGPVIYESEYDVGGHWAAWERPDAIAKDLQAMFGRDGPAFACVTGKPGFTE